MRVHLIAFGSLKERLPEGGVWRELTSGQTIGDLLHSIDTEGTIPSSALLSAAVAVNQEYVSRSAFLNDGDEVAILPPVSGGSDTVALVRTAIDTIAIVESVKAGADGAVVIFDGIVRNNTRGRETLHLDYEAYEEMALKQMGELRSEALRRFAVREILILHRLGRLLIGETSVLIVVASAHRGAAFDACRWVIDTLKKTVPIWKREQFVDGAVWADGEPFPEEIVGAMG